MITSARKLRCLFLAAAAGFTLGAADLRAAVSFVLSPTTVDNATSATLTLTITGLPTVGQSVLVEKFADLNGNGVIDPGDVLVRSFMVTDGQVPTIGGVRNVNSAGDEDGAADGQIVVKLAQPGLDNVFSAFVGNFVYRISDPLSVFSPVTQAFTVTAHTYPQGVNGKITKPGGVTPVVGAFVVLLTGNNGNAVGGTFTDASGNYSLPTALPGSYQVFVIAPASLNLVCDTSQSNATVAASSFATDNQTLVAGTATISGQVTNASNSSGIAGIFIVAQSQDNHLTGAFTDSNGNYTMPATATQWQLDMIDGQLAQKAFLKPQTKATADTTSGNATVNIALTKATALIYGTITDGTNPLIGIALSANDQANLYQASGESTAPTGSYALGVVAGTWNGGASSDQLPAGYIAGPGFNVAITAGQAVQENLVLQPVTAHLQGTVTNGGVPVANVQIDAFINSGNGGNTNISATTDGSGNFDLGVTAGSWSIELDNQSASSDNLVGPNLSFTIIDGQTISGIAYHVLPATGSISGHVTDNSGNPLVNVNVNAAATISAVIYNAGAQTDGTGHYSFPVINGLWTAQPYTSGFVFNPKTANVTSSAVLNFAPTVITSQPQPQIVPAGSAASFSIQTNAPGSPTFQWQVSTNGGSVWSNVTNTAPYSNATTNILSISAATLAMNGDLFRCVVTFTGTPGTENSFAAHLTVNPVAPNFTLQPAPQTVIAGYTATFTVAVDDGSATFQWQGSPDGVTWNNLVNGGAYVGTTLATLGVTTTDQSLNGYQYRCVATNAQGSTTSNAATLTVTPYYAVADFNGDGKSDLLWQDTLTGDRLFWLMNGTAPITGIDLATLPIEWSIGAIGDFNGDGQPDIVWQNAATGERLIWLMSGTTPYTAVALGTVTTDWLIVGAGDMNGDGKADILWTNSVTGERLVWLMNGTTPFNSISLGIVPFQWSLAGTGDFNGDGQTDLLFDNTLTGTLNVWFMNGTTHTGTFTIGTVSPQLQVAGVGDYNGDHQPDILWTNRFTGERSVWLMNGIVHTSTVSITTLGLNWELIHPVAHRVWADFNSDGQSDLIWNNTATGETLLYLMNGTTPFTGVSFGTSDPNVQIAATGDFNADGEADIVWQNIATGDRFIWLMSNTTMASSVDLGVVPTNWSILGTGDFNADGYSDLVWKNNTTGEYVVWLMNGTTPFNSISLGVIDPNLQLVGTGDFNDDSSTDLVWQNTATGERIIWLMNGTTFSSSVSLGVVSTDWTLSGTGDFNGDGQTDLVWTNNVTGERLIWLMYGTTPFNAVSLGDYPTAWAIKN